MGVQFVPEWPFCIGFMIFSIVLNILILHTSNDVAKNNGHGNKGSSTFKPFIQQ